MTGTTRSYASFHLLCQHQCNFVVLPDLIDFAIYICKKMCVT